MALVQTLLVRALVARFWDEPYRKPLVRWGTELHDRFLLPHFVWQRHAATWSTTCSDARLSLRHRLAATRSSSSASPATARVQLDDIDLELRWAIEPWHVLGEESASFGHRPLRRLLGRAPAGQGRRG